MIRRILLCVALPACLLRADTAADLARTIRETGLDADECYHVRELNFNKEDLRFYLTDGFLIFSKPVNGRRHSAVFSADLEGGDAEVMLLPPFRSERQSLGAFTGSPNLDEHFRGALFVFTDSSTGEELLGRAREIGRKSQERGLLLAGQYGSVLRNVSENFESRLVEDVLNPGAESPMFFGAIAGSKLGNFDVFYDPSSREQILVGQLGHKANVATYDIWTSFEARNIRKSGAIRPELPFAISNYRIEAVVDDQLHLSVVTRMTITPARRMRAFPLQMTERMELREARIDGQLVETFSRESMRSTALRQTTSGSFLLVTPEALQPGRAYEAEFRHNGDVIFNAGNGVYAVGARGTWYPHRGAEFTTYELTFRYPKRLSLVSTGEIVQERTEGDTRITRRRTSGPVRFAGFNLGDYEHMSVTKAGYTIDVCANRRMEPQLELKPLPPVPSPGARPNRRAPDLVMTDTAPVRPHAQVLPLTEEVTSAFEFMLKMLGPPPLKTLTVSPIPGAFGQGFPGLVYLSTLSYLPSEQRSVTLRDRTRQMFFSDLLAPHEVAHQWWGNLVTADAYQDAWLMEALANYTALLYIEKRKGQKAMETMLDEYRTRLLGKRTEGGTVESLGPITWGPRLESTDAVAARTIVYEKGSWILHMLRLRMGDEQFLKMLSELRRRYQYKAISTGAFRNLAEEFMPAGKNSLENFFEIWVHGTGIPTLKVNSSVKGKAPALRVTATVMQTDVDEDFSVEVPVEFQMGGGAPTVKWVRTSNDPVSVTITAKRLPTKVTVPSGAVLAKH